LVAKFKYNAEKTAMNAPRRNFKTTGRWHKKVGAQNKAGINLKIPNPSLQRMSVKHLCTARPAGRNRSSEYAQGVEENNKRYQENPLYRTRQEINEHIFGTIKDNGVIITLI
jgi:hypothetical protein